LQQVETALADLSRQLSVQTTRAARSAAEPAGASAAAAEAPSTELGARVAELERLVRSLIEGQPAAEAATVTAVGN
jgi:hypothetical protein